MIALIVRFSARSSDGKVSGRKKWPFRAIFFFGESIAYILKHMEWRKKIFLGIGILFVVIGSLFGWAIWVGADRSEIRAWESSTEENLFGTGDAQTGAEENFGVSEQESSGGSDTSHPESEEVPTRSPETIVAPPVKQESATETSSRSFRLRQKLVNFGFEKAGRRVQDIDTVVLHSSFNNQGGDRYSVDKVIGIWKDYGVAPHFVIDRKGNVYQLVDERDIAYHAGVSEMKDGRKNVNDFSFGVEILNAEDDEYTDAQYGAIRDLVVYLKGTYPIKYVVGHDDIAPGRKTDPWNFDWKRL
jgi:hypothetical protein